MNDSLPKPPAYKAVDIVETAKELAKFMQAHPQEIEKPLIQAGDQLLAFYQDDNFTDSFQDLKLKKQEIIEMAMNDISVGVMTLRSSTIGVAFRGRSLAVYVTPHGSSPQGTVVYSINWKKHQSLSQLAK
jgi:hypothetical protein